MPSMLNRLAIKWKERQQALGYKGKRGNDAVVEYFIGATVALQACGHPEADHVGTCATMVMGYNPFPLEIAAQWAAKDPVEQAPGPAPAHPEYGNPLVALRDPLTPPPTYHERTPR